MFDRLIESRPARPRSGMQLLGSMVLHGGLVAAAVQATTVIAAPSDAPVVPDTIIWTLDEGPAAPETPRAEAAVEDGFLRPAPDPDDPLPVPDVDAAALPPVEAAVPFQSRGRADPSELARGDRRAHRVGPAGPAGARDSAGVFTGTQLDRVVEVIDQPAPVFPRQLRDAGIGGSVDLEFVVGRDGRVEAGSIVVRRATHEAFAASARAAIGATRFRPAMLRGEAVRQFVRQRVRFDLAAASPPIS